MNLSENFIKESIVSAYVKQNELKTLSCDSLRFCASCLQSGYHSALYQLLFLGKCPIHQESFKTQCPNCGNVISYRLNNDSFKKPYGCSKCKIIFCPSLSKNVGKSIIVDEREASLEPLVSRLPRRGNFELLEYRLKPDTNEGFCAAKQEEIITHITSFWSNIMPFSAELKKTLNKQLPISNNFIHLKIEFNETKTKEEGTDFFGREWDKDLYGIYKSIGRHFKKTLLFEHVKCIDSVGRNTWWGEYVSACTGKICFYSNAFLLWRMYFEGLGHPVNLFKKYKGSPLYRTHINWNPPSYDSSESVLKRLFAFECYWVFFECLSIAKTLNSNNTYSFNTFSIEKNYIPYWIIAPRVQGKITNRFDFHYWLNKAELKQLKETLPYASQSKAVNGLSEQELP